MGFQIDYPEGDRYLRIHRPGYNPDRVRTQPALLAGMERRRERLRSGTL